MEDAGEIALVMGGGDREDRNDTKAAVKAVTYEAEDK